MGVEPGLRLIGDLFSVALGRWVALFGQRGYEGGSGWADSIRTWWLGRSICTVAAASTRCTVSVTVRTQWPQVMLGKVKSIIKRLR